MSWIADIAIPAGVALVCSGLISIVIVLFARKPRANIDLAQKAEEVRWAYGVLLQRAPESPTVTARWAKAGYTREALIEQIARSYEFGSKPEDIKQALLASARSQLASR